MQIVMLGVRPWLVPLALLLIPLILFCCRLPDISGGHTPLAVSILSIVNLSKSSLRVLLA